MRKPPREKNSEGGAELDRSSAIRGERKNSMTAGRVISLVDLPE